MRLLTASLTVLLGVSIGVGFLALGAFASGGYVVYASYWMH